MTLSQGAGQEAVRADGRGRVELCVSGAESVVTMDGQRREIPGGWVAVTDGFVTAVGEPGCEPDADRVIDARGCLVTPGLVNTHHHIYQNLTRSFAPALGGNLFHWLRTLYPVWSRLDEEAAQVPPPAHRQRVAGRGRRLLAHHSAVAGLPLRESRRSKSSSAAA